MIDGYIRNGEIGSAIELFDEMPDKDVVTCITCLLMLLFLQITKLGKKLTMNILLVQLLVARLLCMLQLLLNVVEVEANKGGIGWWC